MSRTALITGASAGLGAEFARQLAARGVNLVLMARRTERLTALATELSARHGIEASVIAADLAQASDLDDLQERLGDTRIDWLVNNAGSAGPDLLEEPDWQLHRDYLELMMLSATRLCHTFIPQMQAQGFGRVINVSSIAGRVSQPRGGHYGPAKTYLIALSEELALTLRGTGVHVTALCPGFTHTEFHESPELALMKAGTPKIMWYSVETVVREGLAAVDRGKSIRISGRIYRFIDPIMQMPLLRPFIQSIRADR